MDALAQTKEHLITKIKVSDNLELLQAIEKLLSMEAADLYQLTSEQKTSGYRKQGAV
ncbi:hypothetical protein LB467_10045 [Salegentibacter sp. JZCK2]|uniref:hypothetical protein n=1 Tax=Salegentibacter tibetensis TaxID=2873600 RepID=UPI001CCC54B1|nr:hypothetical protein [Salegentibacter tibetensis]MBZ9730026.1 hypothetical protein [Salegentibacter tibetensis]